MDSEVLIIAIVISIVVFLLLREFVCWYFKINKRVSLLEEMLEEIKKINVTVEKEANKETEIQEKEPETSDKEEPDEEDEEIDPDKPVEDPFWNKKN